MLDFRCRGGEGGKFTVPEFADAAFEEPGLEALYFFFLRREIGLGGCGLFGFAGLCGFGWFEFGRFGGYG